ncbi:hypothetical protein A8709_03510 [Paenibacillus pectinilyticus]|uniref:Uncharacterized protein n=1 Tax=Paenibacillus pectinilyticus TaxID=512399 RepID=A0A1C0ZYX0_9BACL|nr:hypothetical protein [Paenibacillus pectinilyticus]OCT13334.1 hypothetical protein A8709_03510 [Paenibacillus pectinilyticus]
MKWIVLVVILLLVLLLVYKFTLKMKDKVETNKVINMSLQRRKKSQSINKQTCSYCRKKEKKLSFYADEQGRVVGVCKVCQPQAERRALRRL